MSLDPRALTLHTHQVNYSESLDGVTAAHLTGFFEGWLSPPTSEEHLVLLHQSSHRVLARSDSGRIVGFITAISDGVLSAYIPLLEVLPDFRGQGVGTHLVDRMLRQVSHLYMVDLVCDPELVPFYRRFGLQPLSAMGSRKSQSPGAGSVRGHGE